MSDEEIIELFFRRDENAISETDRKYGKHLLALARNIVHVKQDCEECVNDAYLDAWNSIPPERPRALCAFLSKITRRRAIDRYRKIFSSKRTPSEFSAAMKELDECIPSDCDVENEFYLSQIRKILNSFLASLKERDRFVFVCRYYFSDSISGISAMLGISEPTVYRSLSQSRKELTAEFEKEGYNI